ncbi:hypothetical protein HMPREF1550_00262 [Actinomyces sp. oral taxon 877 str. F0543]|nr:hypothetical protein HMPREF1550_00262 [Actinomyces sp. oral taxon 877 str. F0543]
MIPVREHPAPPGALRPPLATPPAPHRPGQGAPSTTRCIRTVGLHRLLGERLHVRERPTPSGALRPRVRVQPWVRRR